MRGVGGVCRVIDFCLQYVDIKTPEENATFYLGQYLMNIGYTPDLSTLEQRTLR
jgi:hypothetical protein